MRWSRNWLRDCQRTTRAWISPKFAFKVPVWSGEFGFVEAYEREKANRDMAKRYSRKSGASRKDLYGV